MKSRSLVATTVATGILLTSSLPMQAQSELDILKAKMKAMEQTMEEMKQKIVELEKQKSAAPPATNAVSNSASVRTIEKIAEGQTVGEKSPITYRGALNDQQEAASRPKDYTLDP